MTSAEALSSPYVIYKVHFFPCVRNKVCLDYCWTNPIHRTLILNMQLFWTLLASTCMCYKYWIYTTIVNRSISLCNGVQG